jgi:hypothetical protein
MAAWQQLMQRQRLAHTATAAGQQAGSSPARGGHFSSSSSSARISKLAGSAATLAAAEVLQAGQRDSIRAQQADQQQLVGQRKEPPGRPLSAAAAAEVATGVAPMSSS